MNLDLWYLKINKKNEYIYANVADDFMCIHGLKML